MKNTLVGLIVGTLIGAAGMHFYQPSTQRIQEPKRLANSLDELPKPYYKVLFENADIRLVEHILKPGETEPAHDHPPMVGYFIEDSTVLISGPDGKPEKVVLPKGQIGELPGVTHSIENIGETNLHTVIVEFKNKQT